MKRQARRDSLKGLAANSEALPGPAPQTPASPASAPLPEARADTQGTSATGRRRAACPPEDKDASPLAPLRRPGRAPHSPVRHPASLVPPSPVSSGWGTRQAEPPPRLPFFPSRRATRSPRPGHAAAPPLEAGTARRGRLRVAGHGRLGSPLLSAGRRRPRSSRRRAAARPSREGDPGLAAGRQRGPAKPRPPVPVPLGGTHPPASRWSRVLCCAMARRSDAELGSGGGAREAAAGGKQGGRCGEGGGPAAISEGARGHGRGLWDSPRRSVRAEGFLQVFGVCMKTGRCVSDKKNPQNKPTNASEQVRAPPVEV